MGYRLEPAAIEQRVFNLEQRQSEDRSKRNASAIEALSKSLVPRGEHEEKWRIIDDAIK